MNNKRSGNKVIEFFEKCVIKDVNPTYLCREERNEFAASCLSKKTQTILNVGSGGERFLKKSMPSHVEVFEVDMQGDCDLKIDLDSVDRFSFENDRFDACCAFDVLEHLENFHKINEELYRMSKSEVLISLPNSAVEIPQVILNSNRYTNSKENGVYSKYYGLPSVKPYDRHRWFLYFEDIIRFYMEFSKDKGCRVEFIVPESKTIRRKIFRFIFGSRLYYTFFCPYVWIKLTKNM
jgi:hypothetical protein